MKVLAVILLCVLMSVLLPLCSRMLSRHPWLHRIILILVFCAYVFLNLNETLLFRERYNYYHLRASPFWTIQAIITGVGTRLTALELLEELLLNILLYVPFGYLLPFCFPSIARPTRITAETVRTRQLTISPMAKVLGIAFVCSGLTECIQLFCKLGICEADDVIHNTLGSLLGYLVYRFTIRKETMT